MSILRNPTREQIVARMEANCAAQALDIARSEEKREQALADGGWSKAALDHNAFTIRRMKSRLEFLERELAKTKEEWGL